MLNFKGNSHIEKENNDPKKGPKKKRSVFDFILGILLILIFLYSLTRNDITFWQQEAHKLQEKIGNEKSETEENMKQTEPESDFIRDTYLNKIDRAGDIKRKANLRDIRNALEMYYAENGSYPKSESVIKLNDSFTDTYKILIKYVRPENLKDPKDPEYYYTYRSDGGSFEIIARLENAKDAECKIDENGFCIYRVSSAQK